MVDEKKHKRLSKFMSLVLRHDPAAIGLELTEEGWTDVSMLIEKMNEAGKDIDFDTLVSIVEQNDKQRFGFSADRKRIRANQGHSIEVKLGYEAMKPPAVLYHGTAQQHLGSIFKTGLEKRNRHHVHLSAERETALKVGQRHGKPILLLVAADTMEKEGFTFYQSENGVWLTDQVPTRFLTQLEE